MFSRYKFIFSLFILVLINSCEEDICPKKPKYYTFTPDELGLLWENVDSVMMFQNKLISGVIGKNDSNNSYGFKDTLKFLNENNDTLLYDYRHYVLTSTSHFCSNEIPMQTNSDIWLIGDNTIKYAQISLVKQITNELICKLNIGINKESLYTKFSLNDSVKISYNIFDDGKNDTNVIYLKTRINDYQFNNETLTKCLFFEFKDLKQNEKFKIIYSPKYGFLIISKNQKELIKRVL
jgi:hypothetical protein